MAPFLLQMESGALKRPAANPRSWCIPAKAARQTSALSQATRQLSGSSAGFHRLPTSIAKPSCNASATTKSARGDDIEDISDDDEDVPSTPAPNVARDRTSRLAYPAREQNPQCAPRDVQSSMATPSQSFPQFLPVPSTSHSRSTLANSTSPPIIHSGSASTLATTTAAASAPSAAIQPRSSLVTGLRLRASQLGEVVTTKSSGRCGGRRLTGPCSSFIQRAANEAAASTQVLLVKHGISGPIPPSHEQLCAAMHSLRHRVLQKTRMISMAPLGMCKKLAACVALRPSPFGNPCVVRAPLRWPTCPHHSNDGVRG